MLGKSKTKEYIYLLDGLNEENSEKLKISLKSVDFITNIKVDARSGIVQLGAKSNPETQLKMACALAGCLIRTQVKKRNL